MVHLSGGDHRTGLVEEDDHVRVGVREPREQPPPHDPGLAIGGGDGVQGIGEPVDQSIEAVVILSGGMAPNDGSPLANSSAAYVTGRLGDGSWQREPERFAVGA